MKTSTFPDEVQYIVEQDRRETASDVELALKAFRSKSIAFRKWPTRKGCVREDAKKYFAISLMPYGVWTCADGREVLFDSEYAPICERRPGSPPRMADPSELVRFEKQAWFYNAGTPNSERLFDGLLKLDEWGVREMILADIASYLKRAELTSREGRRHV